MLFEILLIIGKILFYFYCAIYIRDLYRNSEYIAYDEYHHLRNEYNRIVDYNKELKIKLQEQVLKSASISTSEMKHYIIDGGTRCTASTNLRDMVLEGCSSRSIQERLNNCYIPKAKSIRPVSSLGDLYLMQDTGEVFVKVASHNDYCKGDG